MKYVNLPNIIHDLSLILKPLFHHFQMKFSRIFQLENKYIYIYIKLYIYNTYYLQNKCKNNQPTYLVITTINASI